MAPLPVGISSRGSDERGRREVDRVETVEVAVGAKSLKGPGHVAQGRGPESSASSDDAEQDTRAMRTLGASGEERVESELGDVLSP